MHSPRDFLRRKKHTGLNQKNENSLLNKKSNRFTLVDAAVLILLAAGISYFFLRMGNVLN